MKNIKIGDGIVVTLKDGTEHLAKVTEISEATDTIKFILTECGTVGEASVEKFVQDVSEANDTSYREPTDYEKEAYERVYDVQNMKVADIKGFKSNDLGIVLAEGDNKKLLDITLGDFNIIMDELDQEMKDGIINDIIALDSKNDGVITSNDIINIGKDHGVEIFED